MWSYLIENVMCLRLQSWWSVLVPHSIHNDSVKKSVRERMEKMHHQDY